MAENQDNTEDDIPNDQAIGDEAAEGEESQKKSQKKLIIIVAIIVLLLAGGGVAAMMLMGGSSNKPHIPAEGEHGGAEGSEANPGAGDGHYNKEPSIGPDGQIEETVYYDLKEFIVNLNVGSSTPTFLKMTVSLELPGESQIPLLEAKMPRVRDTFQVYLRELRREDLQGSAGMHRLREELLLRVNKTVYPARVNDLLFKEILVQ